MSAPGGSRIAATDLAIRAVGRAERFASTLASEHLLSIISTVAEGLVAMSERRAEGFTLCPLVTREIRIPRFVARGRIDVDIVACAAILTFHQGNGSGPASWVEAHQGLCRTYYESVLKRFVERRLGQRLSGQSFAHLWQAEAYVAASLGRCLEEMRERFPLEPFQKRCEILLHGGADAGEILRRLTRWMLADASRRLGV